MPLWSVPFVPTQDGPAHLEITALMRRLATGDDGLAGRYLRLDADPEPNWLGYLALAAAFEVAPPRIAEKLVLSLYALALPLSALYAARAVSPRGGAAAFLALPLVFNYPLHMGFYNFSLSLPLFFLTLGWWWRRRAAPGPEVAAGLAALLLVIFAAHPVTWMLSVALLAVVALWDLALGLRGRRRDEPAAAVRRRLRGQAAAVVLAAVPSLALMVRFLGAHGDREVSWLPFLGLVKHLLLVNSLISFQRLESAVAAATGLLFAALVGAALWRRRRPAPHDALLLAAALFLAIYFAAPLSLAGGGYVNQRVQLFVLLALVGWLAGEPMTTRRRKLVAGAASALALAALALHAGSYRRLAPELAAYHAAALAVPEGSTVLPLSFAHRGERAGRPLSLKVSPFENAIGYTVAERPLVGLGNYQATRGQFPVSYGGECDPRLLGTGEAASGPVRPRLDGYAGRPGCTVDFVLLWQPGAAGRERAAEGVRRELRRHGFRPLPAPAVAGGRAELWRNGAMAEVATAGGGAH